MRSIGLGLCFGLIVGCGADGPAAPQDIPREVGMSGEALHVGGDPVGLSLFFRDGTHEPPDALVPTLIICALVSGILFFVLGKPDPGGFPVPDWLRTPLGRQLPFDAPSR